MPQVHHSVREAYLRVGRRTLIRDKGTRRGEERLVEAEQAEVPKVSSVQEAVPPVDWAAEVQRLREELTRVREGRSPILVAHSCQSSSEAANWLQERAAKRCAGVAESVPTNP